MAERPPNDTKVTNAKLEDPSAHFGRPHDVVADPALTKDQKAEALDVLAQDARQRAQASAEGMTADETMDVHEADLNEVLAAKDLLDLSPVASAYGVVLKDMQQRRNGQADAALKASLEQAIATLERVAETVTDRNQTQSRQAAA